MRTLSPLLATPVFAALSIFSCSAFADDATQTDPNLPPLPPATASAPTPAAAAPTPTAPVASSPRVVVVQTADGPRAFQLGPEKKMKSHWYGWQTLTMDAVAITSGAILAKGNFEAAGWVWIGTYTFAPPMVHALHGRIGIAFADLGVRVGAPIAVGTLGLLVGCGASSGGNGDDQLAGCAVGAVAGFFIGYAAAIAVDAAVFAREKVEVDPNEDAEEARAMERQRRQRASAFKIIPDVGLGQNRATFGLSGQF